MITGGAVALQLLGQVGGYYERQKVRYEGEVDGKPFSLRKSSVAWGAKVGGCSIGSGGHHNQQLSDADVLKTIRSISRSPGGALRGEEEGGEDRCLCSLEDFEFLQLTEDWSPWSKDGDVLEEKVPTAHGDLLVAVRGRRGRPAILTYHDLGLNYLSNFQTFFGQSDMSAVLDNFCVYHVTAPGQEKRSRPPAPWVEGLFLVNCVSSTAGWVEWSYQKMTARQLRTKGMTPAVVDYLMWHHFGKDRERRHVGHAQLFRRYWESCVTAANLAAFVGSYARRKDLGVGRGRGGRTLAAPLVNVTGANSPHVNATAALNSNLDPASSSWIKVQDCGMVLVEQPRKVSQAFRLFLQGVGYAVQLSRNRLASSSTTQAAPTPRSGHLEHVPLRDDVTATVAADVVKDRIYQFEQLFRRKKLDSGHWKSSHSGEDRDSGRSLHGGDSDSGSCSGRSSVSGHHNGSPRWTGRSNSVDDSDGGSRRSHHGIRRSISHSGHHGAFTHSGCHQRSYHSCRDRCCAASHSRGHQSSQHCCCAASHSRGHQSSQHCCCAAVHSRGNQSSQHCCYAASNSRDHQCCQHSCSAASNSRDHQCCQHCSCAASHSNGHHSCQHCCCSGGSRGRRQRL